VDATPQLFLPHEQDADNLVPVQIILVLKAKSQGMINSHRWLFNAIGKILKVCTLEFKPKYLFNVYVYSLRSVSLLMLVLNLDTSLSIISGRPFTVIPAWVAVVVCIIYYPIYCF
jgi:Chitin synthase.